MYSGIPDLNSDGEGSDMVRASVGTEEMGGGRSFGSNSSSSGGGDFGGMARKSTRAGFPTILPPESRRASSAVEVLVAHAPQAAAGGVYVC